MTVTRNELDKRIKDFSDIQSYRQYDDKYVGETGYFTDYFADLTDLSRCKKSVLVAIDDDTVTDNLFDAGNGFYRFFIPESLLENVKYYRPFTLDEWKEVIKDNYQWITMKSVATENEYYMQITGCYISELNNVFICLGSLQFSLGNLFTDYRWKDSDGNWRVFGVEE